MPSEKEQAEIDQILIHAASAGDAARVARAIEAGASPKDARTPWGSTALMCAVMAGSVECAQLLIPLCDPSQRQAQRQGQGGGECALSYACAVPGEVGARLARMLMPFESLPEDTRLSKQCLNSAADKGAAEALRELLALGCDARAGRGKLTPLMRASAAGSAPSVLALLPHSEPLAIGPQERGWNALMHAARHGRADALRLLLSAEPEAAKHRGAKGESALMLAARNSPECVRALLPVSDAWAVDKAGDCALCHAARAGSEEWVVAILATAGSEDAPTLLGHLERASALASAAEAPRALAAIRASQEQSTLRAQLTRQGEPARDPGRLPAKARL